MQTVVNRFLSGDAEFKQAPSAIVSRRNELLSKLKPLPDTKAGIFAYNTPVISFTAAGCNSDGQEVVKRLMETVKSTELSAVGLAAPQIGICLRIFIMRRVNQVELGRPWEVFINPSFVPNYSKGTFTMVDEGCLSIPGVAGNVKRYCNIKVTAVNELGKQRNLTLKGYEAAIFQHEYDHLNGILFIDRAIENTLHRLPV